MQTSTIRACALCVLVTTACAPQNIEPASPVRAATRMEVGEGRNDSYSRRADDGVVIGKVVAPAPRVWQAVLEAMTVRKVTPSVLDRPAGRMGDTALVMSRTWHGQPVSRYFGCGSNMTGARADQDRIRSVLLVQLTRLQADTIAVAVHLSGTARAMSSGNSSSEGACLSTGRAESELLDDVMRQLGVGRRP